MYSSHDYLSVELEAVVTICFTPALWVLETAHRRLAKRHEPVYISTITHIEILSSQNIVSCWCLCAVSLVLSGRRRFLSEHMPMSVVVLDPCMHSHDMT